MKRILIITLFLAAIACPDAMGWGQKGHDVVASIAERHLTKRTRKAIAQIIGERSIVYDSSWLDDVQNSPSWQGGYDVTKTWHYFDVDEGYTVETMERNPNGDVLTALDMLVGELKGNYANLTDSMRVDYLRMIVHLMGDLHCPMHAGHLSDIAGNRIKVRWFGSNTNLHSVWDSKLLESCHAWSYSEWTTQLDCNVSTEWVSDTIAGGIESWFAETVDKCAYIYDHTEPDSSLSYQYVHDFRPVVEEQLLKGGYRLAAVLNYIFDK